MAQIVLQFATERSLGSVAIRWFTQSQWSHVDAVLPDGRLLGARFHGGVAVRDRGYLGPRATTHRVAISCSREQQELFYSLLHSQLGEPYDWRAIAAFAIARNWRSMGAWFCSELAGWACECAGAVRRLAVPSNRLTPGGLFLALSAIVEV